MQYVSQVGPEVWRAVPEAPATKDKAYVVSESVSAVLPPSRYLGPPSVALPMAHTTNVELPPAGVSSEDFHTYPTALECWNSISWDFHASVRESMNAPLLFKVPRISVL